MELIQRGCLRGEVAVLGLGGLGWGVWGYSCRRIHRKVIIRGGWRECVCGGGGGGVVGFFGKEEKEEGEEGGGVGGVGVGGGGCICLLPLPHRNICLGDCNRCRGTEGKMEADGGGS